MDLRDLAHRAVFTAIEAFTAVLLTVALADATALADIDVNALEAALVAALAGVLTVVKEYARSQLSKGK
jgi:hypothetical protein